MDELETKWKDSPLRDEHRRLEARMAPFAGWEMPIQYAGIVAEHRAVRESAGVFDISHMGQLEVGGTEAAVTWLNGLLTNDLHALDTGEGQYTLMLNANGGVIDDLIVYRAAETEFFLVVNASKIEEDLAWLNRQREEAAGVTLENLSADYGAIAVQGPRAGDLWDSVGGRLGSLPARNGIRRFSEETGDDGKDAEVVVCRTGYTGEDGFELFASPDRIAGWFRAFLEAGAEPCGLGARDTLRLEKCYPLNGADLDAEHTPLEAGLGFFVKLDKVGGFVGREVLVRQKEEGPVRKLVAIRQTGKGPPIRPGYAVFESGAEAVVATLTSGGLSPTLGCGIGMAYLPPELARPGTELEVEVRGRRFGVEVVKKPFV